jgi:hypothetical protein
MLNQQKSFNTDQFRPVRPCGPHTLFDWGGGVGIQELSKSIEELVLRSGESEVSNTSKCCGLTLSRIIEAFPLARTYATVIMSKSPVAKGERDSVAI